MYFNSPESNYTYHCILSSAIQKHLVIVILSVKKFSLVYCKFHVSEIQYINDTSQNVTNPFLYILINTFGLQASSVIF